MPRWLRVKLSSADEELWRSLLADLEDGSKCKIEIFLSSQRTHSIFMFFTIISNVISPNRNTSKNKNLPSSCSELLVTVSMLEDVLVYCPDD